MSRHLAALSGGEQGTKTKPTQHSVRELRSIGISPDVIVLRSDHPLDEDVAGKVALFCDVEKEAVVPLLTADTIYAVPLSLEEAGLGDWIVQQMDLTESVAPEIGLAPWRHFVADLRRSKRTLRIAIVGKYVALEDSYLSVKEALIHGGMAAGWDIEVNWVSSEDLERGRNFDQLAAMDGIVVPGGFGYRGIEGKIAAARVAREQGVPYLGLCLGMQVMCIEFARFVTGSDEPNSTEFDISTAYPIIDLMPDQRDIADMGGTMRLGVYECELQAGNTRRCCVRQPGFGADHPGAPSPPFRVQQHFPRRHGTQRHGLQRAVARWPARRDRGVARPSVYGGQPVPPGVQEPPEPAAPALPRLCQCRQRTSTPSRGGCSGGQWRWGDRNTGC